MIQAPPFGLDTPDLDRSDHSFSQQQQQQQHSPRKPSVQYRGSSPVPMKKKTNFTPDLDNSDRSFSQQQQQSPRKPSVQYRGSSPVPMKKASATINESPATMKKSSVTMNELFLDGPLMQSPRRSSMKKPSPTSVTIMDPVLQNSSQSLGGSARLNMSVNANDEPMIDISDPNNIMTLRKTPSQSALRGANKRRSRTPPQDKMRKAVSFSNRVSTVEIIDHVEHPEPIEENDGDEDDHASNKTPDNQRRDGSNDKQSAGDGGGGDESENGDSKASFANDMDGSHCSFHSGGSGSGSGSGKPRRIPPAKLDPAERKAKREAALREAKATARSIRMENRNRRKSKTPEDSNFNESGSIMSGSIPSGSGHSAHSSVFDGSTKKKSSLFKNPFKRKSNKTVEVDAGIPAVVHEEEQPHEDSSFREPSSPIPEAARLGRSVRKRGSRIPAEC